MKRIFLILFGTLMITAAHAASFDCKKATSYAEKMVCSDMELSSLDESLAKAYGAALRETPNLTESQRRWLKRRGGCQNRDCLIGLYQERIAELSKMISEDRVICTQLNQLVQNEGTQSLREQNTEKMLGKLCGYSSRFGEVSCKEEKHPFDFARFKPMGIDGDERLKEFISSGYRITVSETDVNNDGFPDLRLTLFGGTASCENSLYFFGTANQKYRTTKGTGIQDALQGDDETRFCYGNTVVFLMRDKTTYSVALDGDLTSVGEIYRGAADGSFAKLCNLSAISKSDWNENAKNAGSIGTQADEEYFLKQAVASVVEFEKPAKIAILNETLSSEDILRPKMPRHIPEHQFSDSIKGVSRRLEQALLDNNERQADQGNVTETLVQNGNSQDFKNAKFNRDVVNLGLIDGKQFATEVDQQVASGPQSFTNSLAIFKFARPAVLGDKALVYVECKFIYPKTDPDSGGAGYGILFKRQNGKWQLMKREEMWGGRSSFSARTAGFIQQVAPRETIRENQK